MKKQNITNIKKEIIKIASKNKDKVPKYLDSIKKDKKEITKDNPYYKYL